MMLEVDGPRGDLALVDGGTPNDGKEQGLR